MYKDYTTGGDYDKNIDYLFVGPFFGEPWMQSKLGTIIMKVISQLHKNETCDLVHKPKGVETISCKWVYKSS